VTSPADQILARLAEIEREKAALLEMLRRILAAVPAGCTGMLGEKKLP